VSGFGHFSFARSLLRGRGPSHKCGDMNVEVTTTEPDFPGRIEVTGIPDYDPKKKDLHINFRWSEAYRGVGPAYLNGKRCEYLGGQLLPPIRE
jgi:hypothetical protein